MTDLDIAILLIMLLAITAITALIYAWQEHEQTLEQIARADRLSADLRARYAADRIAADMRRRETAANMEAVVAAHNLNAQEPRIACIPGSILALPRHTVTPSQFSRN